VKQIYLTLFWVVDLKNAIECNYVCSSEVKSNTSKEISSLFIVIIFLLAKWSRQYSQKGVSFYMALSKYYF